MPDRRGLLLTLGALSTFGPLAMELYLPGLPEMARDLSASASAAQLTITACMVGLGAGQLLVGLLSDALGRRRPLLAGVATFTVVSFLCAVAPSIWTLTALRFVQGLAGSAGITIARAIVRDTAAGEVGTARALANLILVTGLAPLLAPVAGGLLLRVTDWRGVFAVLGALGAGLFVLGALRVPETRQRETGRRASGGSMGVLLRDRAFLGHMLCLAFAFSTLTVYLAGAPFLLEDVHGISPTAFGVVFAVNAAGMIAFSRMTALLVRAHGPGRLLAAGLAGGATAAIAFLVLTVAGVGLAALLPCLFLVIASRGMISPNAQALALSVRPEAAGTAAGLVGICQYGLGALVTPLAGIGGATATVPMALLLAATALAAPAALALLARGRPAVARRA